MVKITEELIRKKAEHNECIIGTLEELSLHQENIERIENIHNWCKNLQILLLQSNLIGKIENLHKLKQLNYLNLAINNIELIENLEGCESLRKLDLTLNFIGDLESVASLRNNIHLRELILTGNPCASYPGYREYVIAILPQIERLDSEDITRSDRIKALQKLQHLTEGIQDAHADYQLFRAHQKDRLQKNATTHLDDEAYWKSNSEHAPETRIEMANRRTKNDQQQQQQQDLNSPTQKPVKLYRDGRPLNINKAQLKFTFCDASPREFLLDLAVYRYLDTSQIDVDLQPTHVTVTIKGKVFQFVFPDEVQVERSSCQRSQITGHLVLKLPRLNYDEVVHKMAAEKGRNRAEMVARRRNQLLEVADGKPIMGVAHIVVDGGGDEGDVPPLEYA